VNFERFGQLAQGKPLEMYSTGTIARIPWVATGECGAHGARAGLPVEVDRHPPPLEKTGWHRLGR
jgi:hypothetical protein